MNAHVLFKQHPRGEWYEGKWQGMGDKKTDIPPYDLIVEMLAEKPVILILDEFQTWFEGLTNSKQYPWRNWAFNFVQILSEIAQKNPELLVLVVSVRTGDSDAYQQIHRVNPVIVDFMSALAKRDRQRLLLYRIFENRMQFADSQIETLIKVHVSECFRLGKIPQPEQERRQEEFIEAWPFAPHLLKLLDDQVLIATDAQETRDLIKILVDIFKNHDPLHPIITAADFSLMNEKSGVASLLDSVANQLHKDLRGKAIRNLEAVKDAVPDADKVVPHCEDIISSLWLRSLTVDRLAGAEPAELQIDITQSKPIGDNQFEAELATIVDNSFNIHQVGSRFVFKHEENARSKLLAHAKNDKLFQHGEDIEHLAKEIRTVIGGPEEVSQKYRVVVLKKQWDSDPWSEFDEKEHPKNWDSRLPLVVVPVYPDSVEATLGNWLKTNLQEGRNTIRFLLPQKGTGHVYFDRELIVLARAVYLAMQWQQTEKIYAELARAFQKDELRPKLKGRFERFTILAEWNYAEPAKCRFEDPSKHNAQGEKIPEAIEKIIREELFIPEEFEEYVLKLAESSESVGKLLRDLREPRPGGRPCIPWLGEVEVKERVIKMCAAKQLAINVRGLELLQAHPNESADDAWQRMKGKLGSGKHLDETTIHLPDAVVVSGGKTLIQQPTDNNKPIPQDDTSGDSTLKPETDTSGKWAPGNLFGQTGNGPTTPTKTPLSSPPTSGLNLRGQVESWQIGPATTVTNVSLKVEKMTGAQLQQLIKHLPDGVTYGLNLEKETN